MASGEVSLSDIVAGLNRELKLSYSLVSFDELRDRQQLGVLSDLCVHLSPDIKPAGGGTVDSEDPASTAQRLYSFIIGILGMKLPPGTDVLAGLTAADRAVTHMCLGWILSRVPDCQRRIYLARYLVPIEVPEDMKATDEQLRDTFALYTSLKADFVKAHKAAEKAREVSGDPAALAKQARALEEERERVQQRVTAARKKLEEAAASQGVAATALDKLVEAADAARRAQEEGEKAKSRMSEQMDALRAADKAFQAAQAKVASLPAGGSDADIERCVAKLREDVAVLRAAADGGAKKELEEKKAALAAVLDVMGSRVDIEGEKSAVLEAQAAVQAIEEKHKPKLTEKQAQDLKLFRQQAGLVLKKRAAHIEEVDRLEAEKLEVERVVREKESELEGFKGGKVLRGEDFKRYAASLRGKSTQYKRMKNELQELRSEFGVLQRTAEVLRSKDDRLEDVLKGVEAQHGAAGFRATAESLDAVSSRKMEVDEAKEKTLDELSKIIQDINTNIKDKRTKLAPHIIDLRNLKSKAQAVEQEYLSKRDAYDGARAACEAEIQRLRADAAGAVEDARDLEARYHAAQAQLQLLQIQAARVAESRGRAAGGGGGGGRTYFDLVDRRAAELDSMSKDLRERKRDIEENHTANAAQLRWFKSLRKLLEMKAAVLRKEASAAAHTVPATGAADYLRL